MDSNTTLICVHAKNNHSVANDMPPRGLSAWTCIVLFIPNNTDLNIVFNSSLALMDPKHPLEPEERQNLSREVPYIRKAILRIEYDHLLTTNTPQYLKIRVLPLDLGGDKALRPKFFTPYFLESFREPTDKVMGDTYTVGGTSDYGASNSMLTLSGC